MGIHEHIWPYMSIYGHIWPYMVIYGHIWPYIWPYMAISIEVHAFASWQKIHDAPVAIEVLYLHTIFVAQYGNYSLLAVYIVYIVYI